jgi:hypothetical protein
LTTSSRGRSRPASSSRADAIRTIEQIRRGAASEVLSDSAEGYIDDFHFVVPTGSLDLQVMYMAITDGSKPGQDAISRRSLI